MQQDFYYLFFLATAGNVHDILAWDSKHTVLLIALFKLFQLKDLAERLPPGVYDAENIRPAYLPNGLEPNGIHYPESNGERHTRAESISGSSLASIGFEPSLLNRTEGTGSYGTNLYQNRVLMPSNGPNEYPDVKFPSGGGVIQASGSSVSDIVDGRDSGSLQDGETGSRSRNAVLTANSNQIEAEWIEQYEPGVYITLMALRDGTRDLKRVRFRYFYEELFIFPGTWFSTLENIG